MAEHGRKKWEELALMASEETDPEKLMLIVKELIRVLDAQAAQDVQAEMPKKALKPVYFL